MSPNSGWILAFRTTYQKSFIIYLLSSSLNFQVVCLFVTKSSVIDIYKSVYQYQIYFHLNIVTPITSIQDILNRLVHLPSLITVRYQLWDIRLKISSWPSNSIQPDRVEPICIIKVNITV